MSSAKIRPLGLRTKLTLWSSLVLAASLAAGFGWVHFGLRRVLEERNEAFLEHKAAELLAGDLNESPDGRAELDAEIRREVHAYEAEGLIVVVREASRLSVQPGTSAARQLAAQPVQRGSTRTITLGAPAQRYR